MKLIIDINESTLAELTKYGEPLPAGNSFYDSILSAVAKGKPYKERPAGHWIRTVGENGVTSAARCSECGFEDNRYMLFRYCPNCDADMRGDKE